MSGEKKQLLSLVMSPFGDPSTHQAQESGAERSMIESCNSASVCSYRHQSRKKRITDLYFLEEDTFSATQLSPDAGGKHRAVGFHIVAELWPTGG